MISLCNFSKDVLISLECCLFLKNLWRSMQFFLKLCRLFLVLLFCRKQRLFWKHIQNMVFLIMKYISASFWKNFEMIYHIKGFIICFLIDESQIWQNSFFFWGGVDNSSHPRSLKYQEITSLPQPPYQVIMKASQVQIPSHS